MRYAFCEQGLAVSCAKTGKEKLFVILMSFVALREMLVTEKPDVPYDEVAMGTAPRVASALQKSSLKGALSSK